MRSSWLVALLVLVLSGCGSVKEKIGEYEKEALIDAVSSAMDKKLASHGLSISTVKSAADVNGDGKLDSKEILSTTTSMAKALALIEAKKVIDDRLRTFEQSHVSKDEFGRERESLWAKIIAGALGLLSTYLGNQIAAGRNEAKKHANYHAKMSILEAMVGKQEEDEGAEEEPDPPAPPATA